ncbi:hypothetical protein OKW21_006013 [Catalinimonas alkaloidigena]|uniref:hypothetical protein n=1 Tax=Catalinimonas alkaloidigena TaxID=1075417 RepID=UPI0024064111|nr:hypothetical protein [Catalinimonas alkaloidigena]MDF9800750.1 hypothetical protein [Catalinimonas alkaloidigena]
MIHLILFFWLMPVKSLITFQKDSGNKTYKPGSTRDLRANPDDEQFMVRQLISAKELEIKGLIVATGFEEVAKQCRQLFDYCACISRQTLALAPSSRGSTENFKCPAANVRVG